MEKEKIIGTLVGESTSKEFRLAVTPEAIREQDIIAVDATLNETEESGEFKKIRVWAKVQRIERINPLFPAEAGHELAETQTDPMDTVLSLSREMVSAVCQVLGYEQLAGGWSGKLESLRYPPKPATRAYDPDSKDLKRVLVGKLEDESKSAINIATLSNRDNVDVEVDGHAIVTRHLAILAMTGAGKTWTARRIIEQLSSKSYPMVIFDPHGDYTGLEEIESLSNKVNRYHVTLPIFEEGADTAAQIISNLASDPLSPTMTALFGDLFNASRRFYEAEGGERINWLANRLNDDRIRNGIKPDLWLIANIADAAVQSIRDARSDNPSDFEYLRQLCWANLRLEGQGPITTLEGIYRRARRAASQLLRMERVNQRIVGESQSMPQNREELVQYGKISVISLAGYTGDFQATIYSIIAEELFEARVTERLQLPFLLLLEEAHNFVPSRGTSSAQQQSIAITKQIAQEGRKFHVGLVVISQRPSRLDETTLSQCNSYIIMRMINPADQTFVKRVIESLGEEEASLLPNLEVGEALLSGQMVNFPILVKMKEPESRGEREETNAFDRLEEVHAEETSDQSNNG